MSRFWAQYKNCICHVLCRTIGYFQCFHQPTSDMNLIGSIRMWRRKVRSRSLARKTGSQLEAKEEQTRIPRMPTVNQQSVLKPYLHKRERGNRSQRSSCGCWTSNCWVICLFVRRHEVHAHGVTVEPLHVSVPFKGADSYSTYICMTGHVTDLLVLYHCLLSDCNMPLCWYDGLRGAS